MSIRKFSTASISAGTNKSTKLWDQETFQSGMFALATVTLSSSASSVVFTGIPNTYTHLQVRCLTRTNLSATTLDTFMKINTGTSYYYHYVYGNGASAAAGGGSNTTSLIGRATGSTATVSTFGCSIVDILDYTNTNKNKTIRVLNGDDNNGNGNAFVFSGLSLSTTAVTDLTFTAEGASSFVQYSHFALYGIKSA